MKTQDRRRKNDVSGKFQISDSLKNLLEGGPRWKNDIVSPKGSDFIDKESHMESEKPKPHPAISPIAMGVSVSSKKLSTSVSLIKMGKELEAVAMRQQSMKRETEWGEWRERGERGREEEAQKKQPMEDAKKSGLGRLGFGKLGLMFGRSHPAVGSAEKQSVMASKEVVKTRDKGGVKEREEVGGSQRWSSRKVAGGGESGRYMEEWENHEDELSKEEREAYRRERPLMKMMTDVPPRVRYGEEKAMLKRQISERSSLDPPPFPFQERREKGEALRRNGERGREEESDSVQSVIVSDEIERGIYPSNAQVGEGRERGGRGEMGESERVAVEHNSRVMSGIRADVRNSSVAVSRKVAGGGERGRYMEEWENHEDELWEEEREAYRRERPLMKMMTDVPPRVRYGEEKATLKRQISERSSLRPPPFPFQEGREKGVALRREGERGREEERDSGSQSGIESDERERERERGFYPSNAQVAEGRERGGRGERGERERVAVEHNNLVGGIRADARNASVLGLVAVKPVADLQRDGIPSTYGPARDVRHGSVEMNANGDNNWNGNWPHRTAPERRTGDMYPSEHEDCRPWNGEDPYQSEGDTWRQLNEEERSYMERRRFEEAEIRVRVGGGGGGRGRCEEGRERVERGERERFLWQARHEGSYRREGEGEGEGEGYGREGEGGPYRRDGGARWDGEGRWEGREGGRRWEGGGREGTEDSDSQHSDVSAWGKWKWRFRNRQTVSRSPSPEYFYRSDNSVWGSVKCSESEDEVADIRVAVIPVDIPIAVPIMPQNMQGVVVSASGVRWEVGDEGGMREGGKDLKAMAAVGEREAFKERMENKEVRGLQDRPKLQSLGLESGGDSFSNDESERRLNFLSEPSPSPLLYLKKDGAGVHEAPTSPISPLQRSNLRSSSSNSYKGSASPSEVASSNLILDESGPHLSAGEARPTSSYVRECSSPQGQGVFGEQLGQVDRHPRNFLEFEIPAETMNGNYSDFSNSMTPSPERRNAFTAHTPSEINLPAMDSVEDTSTLGSGFDKVNASVARNKETSVLEEELYPNVMLIEVSPKPRRAPFLSFKPPASPSPEGEAKPKQRKAAFVPTPAAAFPSVKLSTSDAICESSVERDSKEDQASTMGGNGSSEIRSKAKAAARMRGQSAPEFLNWYDANEDSESPSESDDASTPGMRARTFGREGRKSRKEKPGLRRGKSRDLVAAKDVPIGCLRENHWEVRELPTSAKRFQKSDWPSAAVVSHPTSKDSLEGKREVVERAERLVHFRRNAGEEFNLVENVKLPRTFSVPDVVKPPTVRLPHRSASAGHPSERQVPLKLKSENRLVECRWCHAHLIIPPTLPSIPSKSQKLRCSNCRNVTALSPPPPA